MAKTQAASWAVADEFWKRVVGKHCVRCTRPSCHGSKQTSSRRC